MTAARRPTIRESLITPRAAVPVLDAEKSARARASSPRSLREEAARIAPPSTNRTHAGRAARHRALAAGAARHAS